MSLCRAPCGRQLRRARTRKGRCSDRPSAVDSCGVEPPGVFNLTGRSPRSSSYREIRPRTAPTPEAAVHRVSWPQHKLHLGLSPPGRGLAWAFDWEMSQCRPRPRPALGDRRGTTAPHRWSARLTRFLITSTRAAARRSTNRRFRSSSVRPPLARQVPVPVRADGDPAARRPAGYPYEGLAAAGSSSARTGRSGLLSRGHFGPAIPHCRSKPPFPPSTQFPNTFFFANSNRRL